MGRISCAGRVFVAVAGAGVVEAETGGVGVVVVGVVVLLEVANFRPRAEVSRVIGESFGRPRRREEEPSVNGVPNLSDHEAGLLANVERSSAISWVSKSWRIVVGELVPDGVDDGTDPVGKGELVLSF